MDMILDHVNNLKEENSRLRQENAYLSDILWRMLAHLCDRSPYQLFLQDPKYAPWLPHGQVVEHVRPKPVAGGTS